MGKEYDKGIFQEYVKGGKTTHTPPIAKLTPISKYMKIQKKKYLLQRLLKMPLNTKLKPYTTRMAKIQGLKEGKPILICTEISGLILSPWAQNIP